MDLTRLKVLVRGGGEQASGVAHRLLRSGFRVALTEVEAPLAVRRAVSFCEAVWDGASEIEGVRARRAREAASLDEILDRGEIPVLVDPDLSCLAVWQPQVLVDATLTKRNRGLRQDLATLVVALGPGFTAGIDADVVVETNRGHDMGRLFREGRAEPDTGVPGESGGFRTERVLRAPKPGTFETRAAIGDPVEPGQVVAYIGGEAVAAAIPGVLRGLLRAGVWAVEGLKVGDVDPSGDQRRCFTISDKARALGGAVLEAILERFNR